LMEGGRIERALSNGRTVFKAASQSTGTHPPIHFDCLSSTRLLFF
jgi:hypothetical protein